MATAALLRLFRRPDAVSAPLSAYRCLTSNGNTSAGINWTTFSRAFISKPAGNCVIGIGLGTTNSCVSVMGAKLTSNGKTSAGINWMTFSRAFSRTAPAGSSSAEGKTRFKTCRLLLGNVWKRELTIIQRRILRKLRNLKRSTKKRVYMKKNRNSYIQLQTTRKLSLFYGNLSITEMHRRTGHASYTPFLLNLETRLDVILVRLHFCETINQARQLISHRKVCVNNEMVNKRHMKLSHGDIISFQDYNERIPGEVPSVAAFNQKGELLVGTPAKKSQVFSTAADN